MIATASYMAIAVLINKWFAITNSLLARELIILSASDIEHCYRRQYLPAASAECYSSIITYRTSPEMAHLKANVMSNNPKVVRKGRICYVDNHA